MTSHLPFKKIIPVVLGLFIWICLKSETNQPRQQILYWNEDHRLLFTDFRGIPDKETISSPDKRINLIHSLGTINKGIEVHLITNRSHTIFTIYAGMKKDSSWIRNENDSITLRHEQGHFDICELYARMLRRDIKKAKSIAATREIYNRILDQEDAEQNAYDRENTFETGGISMRWQDSISNRILTLDRYKNPVVILSVLK